MIEELEGATFPDRPYRICSEKVSEFVSVTGDDPDRWRRSAPPGFAAALLFVVAPELLDDPRLHGAVVHGDQAFTWHQPLTIESDLAVTGTVDRVRIRGEVAFVAFSLSASGETGTVVEGRSTFLVGGSGPESAEVEEPSVTRRGPSTTVRDVLPTSVSASRADLVRYAAATRDWNPIHWDHAAAVAAGLGGTVVHGLLQSAWLTQAAASPRSGERPLASARFRYTAPLRPGVGARIEGHAGEDVAELRLVTDDGTTVTGKFEMSS